MDHLYRSGRMYLMMFLIVAVGTAGCVSRTSITVHPNPDLPTTAMGQEMEVALNILDKRSTGMSNEDPTNDTKQFTISDTNLLTVYQELLVEGLKNRQFKPIMNQDDVKRKLTVEILTIALFADQGVVLDTLSAESSIRVIAQNGEVRMVNRYRVRREHPYEVRFLSKPRRKILNKTVSAMLSKMMADQKLFSFLSR